MNGFNKIFRIFLLVATVTLTFSVTAFSKNRAEIKFEETKFDFGVIQEKGNPVTHNFEFINKGNANLVIIDATAQCGCTKPKYPKNPISPGKKGIISVTFHPRGFQGEFEKTVTVRTNGSPKRMRLHISGVVKR